VTKLASEKLLTVDEVAEFLNVSKMTVYRMIRRGEIAYRKIGGQFRFDPAIATGMRSRKAIPTSKLGTPGSTLRSEDAWIAKFVPMFSEFIKQHFEIFKPDFVIMNHRKAARFFEVADLIPLEYADKTVYWTAFRWISDDKLHSMLQGKRVLILDEMAQRARQLKRLRDYFEKYGAEVRTVALTSRKSCITDGTLLDSQLISCMTLEDYEFSYMAANMLNAAILGSLPLDTDHVKFILSLIAKSLGRQDIEELAASIGETYFLPPPVNRRELVCLTIELLDCFDWSRLRLPSDIRKEGVCKIRVFYDEETKKLHIIPVIFPKLVVKTDDILTIVGKTGEPWSPYMAVPSDFKDLSIETQVELLHRLLINYSSVQLGLIAMSNIMKLLPDGFVGPENITVEYEDWIKVLGPELGHEIQKPIENDSEQGIRKLFLLPRDKRESLDCRVKASYELGKHASSMKKDVDDLVEITCERMIAELRKRLKVNETRGMAFSEFQEVLKDIDLHLISRAIDILLDAGIIKPSFEVRKMDESTYVCMRTYSLSEFGSWFEGPKAFTTEDIAERKIAKILLYSLQRFVSNGLRPRSGTVQKIFANLQHDWDYMRFEPLFLGWVPYVYGPMVLVPKKRAPFGGYSSLRQYAEEQNLVDPKSIKFDIWKPSRAIQEDALFEEMEPEEVDFLEGLLDIYRAIYTAGDDENTNVLRTLAACRNRRLTYICTFEELEIWIELVKTLIARVEREICELPSIFEAKNDQHTIEPILEDIANAHHQLKDKIDRYRTLDVTKEKIKKILANHPRRSLARAVLEKIEVPIDLSDELPYPVGRLMLYEPIVGCFSSLLRQGFSSLGLAQDTRREKIDYYSGKEKNVAFYSDKLIGLCPELSSMKDKLDEFEGLVKLGKRTPLIGAAVRQIFDQLLTILRRDIPSPPTPQKNYVFRIDPESFRKKILEATSALKDPDHLLCVVIDAHGFVPWSEKLAKQLNTEPDTIRESLQKAVHQATADIAAKMNPIHFIPLGGDGALLTFSDYEQGLSFSCQLQANLSRDFVSFVKIGVDMGDPKADYGAPYGKAFITAYYLTDKIGLSPGQIAVTQEVFSLLNETLKKRCSLLGKYTLRTRQQPIDVFKVDWTAS